MLYSVNIMKSEPIGFIILRHVSSEDNNRYWIKSYECVRRFHPEAPIMIIDDNSRQEYLTNIDLYKTMIIYAEHPKRAELLPYLYYKKYKIAEQAIIIHDSLFINCEMDFTTNTWKPIWEFEHTWDQPEDELRMLRVFGNNKILRFHEDKTNWKGTMGVMTIINHDFLCSVYKTFDFHEFIELVKGRFHRQTLERVISCIFHFHEKQDALLGNMQKYMRWGTSFDTIFNNHEQFKHLHVLKCWSGR